jgi:hypothetical protein
LEGHQHNQRALCPRVSRGGVDRQWNDRLGRTRRRFEHWREILRASRFAHTHANTFSDPNRDRYANGYVYAYTNSNAYSHSDCYTNRHSHADGYTNSDHDGNAYTNCHSHSDGDCDAYCHGQTYTDPKDRSHTESSADARTAPVTLKAHGMVDR